MQSAVGTLGGAGGLGANGHAASEANGHANGRNRSLEEQLGHLQPTTGFGTDSWQERNGARHRAASTKIEPSFGREAARTGLKGLGPRNDRNGHPQSGPESELPSVIILPNLARDRQPAEPDLSFAPSGANGRVTAPMVDFPQEPEQNAPSLDVGASDMAWQRADGSAEKTRLMPQLAIASVHGQIPEAFRWAADSLMAGGVNTIEQAIEPLVKDAIRIPTEASADELSAAASSDLNVQQAPAGFVGPLPVSIEEFLARTQQGDRFAGDQALVEEPHGTEPWMAEAGGRYVETSLAPPAPGNPQGYEEINDTDESFASPDEALADEHAIEVELIATRFGRRGSRKPKPTTP
jgi:hypothetical protein